jgi:peptidyl-prolyl cis-trans isomerase SurA
MRHLTLLAAIGFAVATWPRPAHSAIVERVVAVVGERPILLSELRRRVQPNLPSDFEEQNPVPREDTKLYRSVLDHMIEEQLIEQAAQKAHLAVNVADIDRAIDKKASELGITSKELLDEATREGLSEQDYRDEIRRQILEGKLVQLRVAGRVRVTEADGRAAYQKWAKEFEAGEPVELHVLAMLVPQNATQAVGALAQQIVAQAQAGTPFCNLVTLHSNHTPSKNSCGARIVPLKALPPAVQNQIAALNNGSITPPIWFGTSEVDIIELVRRVQAPPYEEVREKMMELAGAEVLQHERDRFLLELRRGVYVDIRLNS